MASFTGWWPAPPGPRRRRRGGSFSPLRNPIGSYVWRRADRPPIGKMIADERVQQKSVGPVGIIGVAAKRPDVVDDRARHPGPLIASDDGHRGPRTPSMHSERGIGR